MAMAGHADFQRPARGLLHVIHGHGGGTEHHVRALIEATRTRYRHRLAIAVDDVWQVEEHLSDGTICAHEFRRGSDESWSDFFSRICATFSIDLIHLHNISGCRDGIVAGLAAQDVPYGYTAHDLGFACPTILFLGVDGSYCGEITDARACRACLRAQPAFAAIDIVDWRARHGVLVANAAFLIAPSRWAASALERYYPECRVTFIAHEPPAADLPPPDPASDPMPPATPREGLPLPDDGVPTVAILGAVGPDKGARRLERLVALARSTHACVRFVLIGYMDVQHGPWQSDDARLTVHGRYYPRDLPYLLEHYRVRLVAFPSAGPETFCFTLSETWAAGLPVVVPPFGALAERVADTGAGWQWRVAEWRDERQMLARIMELIASPNAASLAAAAARGRAILQSAPGTMAERTRAIYDAAIAASARTVREPARAAHRGPPSAPDAPSPWRLRLSRLVPARLRSTMKSWLR